MCKGSSLILHIVPRDEFLFDIAEMLQCSLCVYTHHQARCESHHIRDSVLHGSGLLVEVDMSEHHTVHQRCQQEVNMANEDHAQPHLHQGLRVLQVGTTHS